jgi:hypothetical protein
VEDWSPGISDLGLEELQSDPIHSKNPQSAIPNLQLFRSNPLELFVIEAKTKGHPIFLPGMPF